MLAMLKPPNSSQAESLIGFIGYSLYMSLCTASRNRSRCLPCRDGIYFFFPFAAVLFFFVKVLAAVACPSAGSSSSGSGMSIRLGGASGSQLSRSLTMSTSDCFSDTSLASYQSRRRSEWGTCHSKSEE